MKYSLENVTVENPCSAEWDEMKGNEEVRLCGQCRHNIHNISEMPKRRALKVLNQKAEVVCIAYQTDEKNRIITQTYFGVFKRHLVKIVGMVLATVFSLTSIYALQTGNHKHKKHSYSKLKKKAAKSRKNRKRIVKPPPPTPPHIVGRRALPRKIGIRVVPKSSPSSDPEE